ncbi:MAG: T9SS type A sorting domain-containing protein [Bacteroidota bacterium]
MKKTLIILSLFIYANANAQNAVFDWAKSIRGSNLNNQGNSIVVDASGNVYTTGMFSGAVDFDPGVGVLNLTSPGSNSIFVSKSDSSGNIIWAKAMVGNGYYDYGYANSIVIDKLGNIYTTGTFTGTIDFDPGVGVFNLSSFSQGFYMFISKLDASGNFVWANAIGCSQNGDVLGNSIAIDTSNNVYITGLFYGQGGAATVDFDLGPGVFNLTSYGGSDIFILKLDASANFVWARSIGGTDWDFGKSIAIDVLGNIYTSGHYSSTVDFDPGVGVFNLISMAQSSAFVSKLDASGNFVWAKTMEGGTGNTASYGNSIVLDATDNVYTTGNFIGTLDFDPGVGVFNLTAVTGVNIFVSKLDVFGNFIWAKAMGGITNVDALGTSIAVDASENVYTTGYFQDTVDFDPGSGVFNLVSMIDFSTGSPASSQDIFISKLDSFGNFVFAKKMSGSGNDYGSSIAIDASENIYTTGYFRQDTVDFDPGAGVFNLSSAGGGSIFIHKLKPCTNTFFSLTEIACFNFILNNQTYTTSGTYTQVLTNAPGCDSILTINLTVLNDTQPICLVTVDSASTHNIVIWEKEVTTQIDSFKIYREVSSNVYSQIASVAYDSLSEYHDYGANPNVTSFKYKIEILSKCGTVSPMSKYHNTIHLQNFGGNLQWTLYNIENTGNPVTYYRLFRDDNGTGNFLPISSTIPGGNSTYTDINYSSFPNGAYLVDVTWNISCTPTRSISTTRSNVKYNNPAAGVLSQKELNNQIAIYPNPYSEKTTITYSLQKKSDVRIEIYNAIGQKIETLVNTEQTEGDYKYNFSAKEKHYNAGVYFMKMSIDGKISVRRIIEMQ